MGQRKALRVSLVYRQAFTRWHVAFPSASSVSARMMAESGCRQLNRRSNGLEETVRDENREEGDMEKKEVEQKGKEAEMLSTGCTGSENGQCAGRFAAASIPRSSPPKRCRSVNEDLPAQKKQHLMFRPGTELRVFRGSRVRSCDGVKEYVSSTSSRMAAPSSQPPQRPLANHTPAVEVAEWLGTDGAWACRGEPRGDIPVLPLPLGSTRPPGPCQEGCRCGQVGGRRDMKPVIDDVTRRVLLTQALEAFEQHRGVRRRGKVSRFNRFEPAFGGSAPTKLNL
eukprot:TRINITY_DN15673_c0_g1_i1.p1 TRINITY_DN15673_c0_g1~~TRINITY_DN15673_c0_g1_i1.p1  ORF type:complete len:282 (+),score=24.88 TRINITY_DN15673_c0_g1_i1:214-1059(+)